MKIVNSYSLTAAVLLSLNLNTVFANTSTYSPACPKQISVSQTIDKKFPGWELFDSEASYYLNGISFYFGEPKNLASLAPDTTTQAKSTWRFNSSDQIYVVCEYNQTNLQLTQKLLKATKSCSVIYDQNTRGSNGFIPKKIICSH